MKEVIFDYKVLFSPLEGQVVILNNETGRHELWVVVTDTTEPVIDYDGSFYTYLMDIKLQDSENIPQSYYETLAKHFFKNNVDMPKAIKDAQANLRSAVNDDYQELEDESYTVHVATLVGESYGQYTYLAVATAFGTVEELDNGEIDREWYENEVNAMDILVSDVDTMSGLVADLINEASELKGTFFFTDFEGCGYSLVYTIDVETMVENGMCPKCGGEDLETTYDSVPYDSVPYGSTNVSMPSGARCTDCGEEY